MGRPLPGTAAGGIGGEVVSGLLWPVEIPCKCTGSVDLKIQTLLLNYAYCYTSLNIFVIMMLINFFSPPLVSNKNITIFAPSLEQKEMIP